MNQGTRSRFEARDECDELFSIRWESLDMYRRIVAIAPNLGEPDRAIRQPETAWVPSEQAYECAHVSPMDIVSDR
jgi:hypothetical protein